MGNFFATKDKFSIEYQRQLRQPNGADARKIGNDLLIGNAELLDNLASLIPNNNYDLIVDVGCGPGYLLSKLANRFPCTRIIGIDPSIEMVQMAKELNSQLIDAGRVQLIQGQSPILPLKNNSCDIMLLANVIYFWEDLRANFEHFYQHLKINGALLIYLSDKASLKVNVNEKDGIFKMYDKKTVSAELKKVGFRKIEILEVKKKVNGINRYGYNVIAWK